MSGRTVYVGGLDEAVTEPLLRAAFLPFGDLKEAQLPLDMHTQANKGFAFVEFELEEDAAAAIANLDGSELFGRVLKVNLAKPNQGGGSRGKAVWAEAQEWYAGLQQGEGEREGGGGGEGAAASGAAAAVAAVAPIGAARPPAAQQK